MITASVDPATKRDIRFCIINSQFATSMGSKHGRSLAEAWDLGIEIWYFFGDWDLVIGILHKLAVITSQSTQLQSHPPPHSSPNPAL